MFFTHLQCTALYMLAVLLIGGFNRGGAEVNVIVLQLHVYALSCLCVYVCPRWIFGASAWNVARWNC